LIQTVNVLLAVFVKKTKNVSFGVTDVLVTLIIASQLGTVILVQAHQA
jgi:hypothetical protein